MSLARIGWEFDLARKYLGARRSNRFASLIGVFSVTGVFIGTAALVLSTSLMNGFEEQVRDRLIGRDAHLDILPAGSMAFPDGDSLPDRIAKADPRVVATSPFIMGKAGISSQAAADGIVVYGVDEARFTKVIDIARFITAGKVDLATTQLDSGRLEHGIFMGDWLAQRLGVIPGEKVTLISLSSPRALTGQEMPRFLRARVTGLFHTGMYEVDANMAYIGLPAAQKLYEMPGHVAGIQVRVSDIWKARDVGNALYKALGGGVRPLDWLEKNENIMKWMKVEKMVVALVICLIVLVAAFNIASSLIMAVMERTREIGILRTMGAESRSVLAVFVLQGSFAGTLGAVGGGLFGLLLCWIQDTFHVVTIPGDVYFIDHLPVSVHALDVVLILASALAISLAASFLPAWYASRLRPMEAVRHE